MFEATALIALEAEVGSENLAQTLTKLTTHLDDERVGFTREVVDDLVVRARDERITAWAQGCRPQLGSFQPEYDHKVWLIQSCELHFAYSGDFVSPEGAELSVCSSAALARRCDAVGKQFQVVTEEYDELPRPSMFAMCEAFAWQSISVADAIQELT